jgi:tetratricopeptide (TPR) repeat protein
MRKIYLYSIVFFLLACQSRTDQAGFKQQLQSIDLFRGEIALCGSETGKFGTVGFEQSCAEKVRTNFNLATALLHSFEYAEAEKVFVKVIDEDPDCLMAYWGVAMSNFHPLWAAPTPEELEKGSATIKLARTLTDKPKRESDYLEAIGVFYDSIDQLNHRARLLKFEQAAQEVYNQYPDDKEAAVFYALALRAAADPTDKTFARQRKAGAILEAMFANEPDHPGIAHYLIHTYDYPELAELGLPAARKYASIAATSAHALHMPSHIFTRLGLWEESVKSNAAMIEAAKCYASNLNITAHWDEEIHGIDYLVYAALQQGKDSVAKAQRDYLGTITEVFPINNKEAYSFAAVPARYALERKDWNEAINLQLKPDNFPWEKFYWERSIIALAKVLGAVHLKNNAVAEASLTELKANFEALKSRGIDYQAIQVGLQVKSAEAWISFMKGDNANAIQQMSDAADFEDATDKPPVTPGEVIPARELLGDLLMELKQYKEALQAYEADLERHPRRLNGIYGAGLAAQKSGDAQKATLFYQQLVKVTEAADTKRPEFIIAQSFIDRNL